MTEPPVPEVRGRIGVIFLTVLIDLIGFGIVLPIIPYYAQSLGADGLRIGILFGAFSGMQFLATAMLGRVSDRIGRRPVLLLTIALNTLGYLLFAYAVSYPVLLLARLVSGFAGGNISAAYAYIADITPPERRSKSMGIIGVAFGIGFVVGPSVGGLSAHYLGTAAPGLVAAGLSLINLVLAWRILPESLAHANRTRKSLFDFGHIGDVWRDARLRPLMGVWLLVPFAFAGFTTVLPLHGGAAFGWTAKELGWCFTLVGLTAAVVQGWAFGRLARRAGDRRLLIFGTVGMALTIAAVPWLPSGAALFAWTPLIAFSNSLFAPAASGMVSILADATEQGTVLGAAQAVAALGRLAGPEVSGLLLDTGGARLSFAMMGVVLAAAAVVALAIPRGSVEHLESA